RRRIPRSRLTPARCQFRTVSIALSTGFSNWATSCRMVILRFERSGGKYRRFSWSDEEGRANARLQCGVALPCDLDANIGAVIDFHVEPHERAQGGDSHHPARPGWLAVSLARELKIVRANVERDCPPIAAACSGRGLPQNIDRSQKRADERGSRPDVEF